MERETYARQGRKNRASHYDGRNRRYNRMQQQAKLKDGQCVESRKANMRNQKVEEYVG